MKKSLFLASLLVGIPFWLGHAVVDAPFPRVQVSISDGPHGAHTLQGQFLLMASSQAAWGILTDYDHMADFVSSIKSSRRVTGENNDWKVEQVMTGHAGIFRKKIYVLLEVTENPFQTILFRDISKQSFKSYVGSWEIQDHGTEVEILYQLEVTPNFFAPDFIAEGAFKRDVSLLLEQVRDEIIKRDKVEK